MFGFKVKTVAEQKNILVPMTVGPRRALWLPQGPLTNPPPVGTGEPTDVVCCRHDGTHGGGQSRLPSRQDQLCQPAEGFLGESRPDSRYSPPSVIGPLP